MKIDQSCLSALFIGRSAVGHFSLVLSLLVLNSVQAQAENENAPKGSISKPAQASGKNSAVSNPQDREDMSYLCVDINAVAEEAVKYYMTGAPMSDLPNNCAKKMKWKYFDPNIEIRNYPPRILPEYTFFDPKKDKYKIHKVRKVEGNFEIDVNYVIKGKKISTTYYYRHIPTMQKYQKVCGVIDHPQPPWIFFEECKK